MYNIKRYEDISKAGTSAGAVKGWVTRRRGGSNKAFLSAFSDIDAARGISSKTPAPKSGSSRRRGGDAARKIISGMKASEASAPKSGNSRRRGGLSPKAKASLQERVAREYRAKNGMPPGRPGVKAEPEAKKKHKSLERDLKEADRDYGDANNNYYDTEARFNRGAATSEEYNDAEGALNDAEDAFNDAQDRLDHFAMTGNDLNDEPLPPVQVGTGKTKPKKKPRTKLKAEPSKASQAKKQKEMERELAASESERDDAQRMYENGQGRLEAGQITEDELDDLFDAFDEAGFNASQAEDRLSHFEMTGNDLNDEPLPKVKGKKKKKSGLSNWNFESL